MADIFIAIALAGEPLQWLITELKVTGLLGAIIMAITAEQTDTKRSVGQVEGKITTGK